MPFHSTKCSPKSQQIQRSSVTKHSRKHSRQSSCRPSRHRGRTLLTAGLLSLGLAGLAPAYSDSRSSPFTQSQTLSPSLTAESASSVVAVTNQSITVARSPMLSEKPALPPVSLLVILLAAIATIMTVATLQAIRPVVIPLAFVVLIAVLVNPLRNRLNCSLP